MIEDALVDLGFVKSYYGYYFNHSNSLYAHVDGDIVHVNMGTTLVCECVFEGKDKLKEAIESYKIKL